jgi:hypothetical protein
VIKNVRSEKEVVELTARKPSHISMAPQRPPWGDPWTCFRNRGGWNEFVDSIHEAQLEEPSMKNKRGADPGLGV